MYSRSGVTLDAISPSGTTQATAAPVTANSGHAVLVAGGSLGGLGVLLPSTAEVGDVVEIYGAIDSFTFDVYPEPGATINGGAVDAPTSALPSGLMPRRIVLRKTSAAGWHIVSAT